MRSVRKRERVAKEWLYEKVRFKSIIENRNTIGQDDSRARITARRQRRAIWNTWRANRMGKSFPP